MKKTYEIPTLDILKVLVEDCMIASNEKGDDLGDAPEGWV